MSENELRDYDQGIEQRQNSPSVDDDDLWSDEGASEEDLWENDLTSGPLDFD